MTINDFLSLNPWWEGKNIQKKYELSKQREQVALLLAQLSRKDKITALIGPRQVGKTTCVMHSINRLLAKNINPKHIFYISFDRSLWQKIEEQDIINLIQDLTQRPPRNLKRLFYLYLDEIHKLQNWENKIKYILEAFGQIKIVISGSSSLNIEIGAGEGLVGRLEIIRVFPLNFKEYLNWHDAQILKNKEFKQDQIQIYWQKYLQYGGYPAILAKKDQAEIYDVLMNYKSLSVIRDIVRLLKIGEPALLEDLLDILSTLITERINYSNLGRLTGAINVHTIKKYLNLLESAFFVKRAEVWRKGKQGLRPYRRDKKIFFLDTGMRNALFQETFKDNLVWSKLAENAVIANYYTTYNSQHPFQKKLYYWLENGGEVDLVTHNGEPVEVKYKDKLEPNDFASLRNFMQIFGEKRGLILTKNMRGEQKFAEGAVKIAPAWEWAAGVCGL